MSVSPIAVGSDPILYEQVANRLQAMITDGTLKPGDRLPSVRKLRQHLAVSQSTVLAAYRLLEDRGLIWVRPQSGYYVKAAALRLSQPNITAPPDQACAIDTSLTFQLIRAMRDRQVIQLGAATPALELLPLAQLNRLMGQMLREHMVQAHSYDEPLGTLVLRSELAKRMLAAGCAIPPDQLVVTNGANEAIYLSLRAVTQPGDTVAIESPTYFTMLEAMKSLQLKALTLPTHPHEGISLRHLEEALAQRQVQAVLLVSNFSNPLGSCMSDAKKKQLVELLNRYDVPLIEDDVYGELYFSGTRPKAIKAFDTEQRVLYCASVSKTLSPGLRVGWCAGGRYHQRVAEAKAIVNQTTAIAPQLTVAAFLGNGGYDRHLRQLRRAYQTHMTQMLEAISTYFPAATRVTHPTGGHVLWLELPPTCDTLHLYHAALEHQISIAPGPIFSPSGQGYRNCLRLNTAIVWSPAVEQAIQTLGDLAQAQL